jgi:hypothetical protein
MARGRWHRGIGLSRPEPGQLIDRTGRAELQSHYRQYGRHIVAMVDAATTLELPGTDGVAMVERLAERGTLVATVREVLGAGSPGGASPALRAWRGDFSLAVETVGGSSRIPHRAY